MKRRGYTIIEVGVSVAIVIASIGIRFASSIPKGDNTPRETTTLGGVNRSRRGHESVPLPLPERIVAQEERFDGERHRSEIAWVVTDTELPDLCTALERRGAVYTIQPADDGRWDLVGTIDSSTHHGGTDPGEPSWLPRIAPLLDNNAVEAPTRPRMVIVQETPTAPSQSTGGSGGVRFEQRGSMEWLWDESILRLEPAR